MTEINNYNNSRAVFSGVPGFKNKNKKADAAEQLINKSAAALREEAERRVPENNKFTRIFAAFDIPETNCEALISIMHDEIEPKNTRRLDIDVHKAGLDKFYSLNIFKGTKKEILNFLSDEKNTAAIKSAVKKLLEILDKDS